MNENDPNALQKQAHNQTNEGVVRMTSQVVTFQSDEWKIHFVDVDKINTASFNPPTRITSQAISELKASVAQIGFMSPLLVTKDMDLIDGHRRLVVARSLGIKQMPVLIKQCSQIGAYGQINTAPRKMSSAEYLWVWLCGADVPPRHRKPITTLEKMIGREYLEKLALQGGGGANVITLIGRLMSYLQKNDPPYSTGENKFANRAAKWIIDQNQSFKLRSAIAWKLDPHKMIECIENNMVLPF